MQGVMSHYIYAEKNVNEKKEVEIGIPEDAIERIRSDARIMFQKNFSGALIELWFEVPLGNGQIYGELLGIDKYGGSESSSHIKEFINSRLEKAVKKGKPVIFVDSRS